MVDQSLVLLFKRLPSFNPQFMGKSSPWYRSLMGATARLPCKNPMLYSSGFAKFQNSWQGKFANQFLKVL